MKLDTAKHAFITGGASGIGLAIGKALAARLGDATLRLPATLMAFGAVSPMLATVLLKRPLTNREAGVLFGSCVIPIVGGWLVNEAYNANPHWEPGYVPVKVAHKKKK